MKRLVLSTALIALTLTCAWAGPWDNGRNPNVDRAIEWEQQRVESSPVLVEQRDRMRKDFETAKAMQDEVDAHYAKQRKNLAPLMLAEGCRTAVIEESILRFGYVKTTFFNNAYGECLRMNGISYD
ncbi:hypothetical protein Acj9p092 [Acinetobacter phage Acj9]|uniref:Uncharacterized protein n=1 Tax=Acinetobacter phage Acj9 TaxID=760939 RepID=E5EPM6_9CAUD|nr:hypothetical protein Acj9p092 [Acinetobacter phage Acj9]ADG59992.1 hypothetical protein Acj9p092 [Acinetobacter phage Acj9]